MLISVLREFSYATTAKFRKDATALVHKDISVMVWAKGILTFWNFPNRKTKLDRRPDFLEFQSSSFLPVLCQTETISKAWNKHLKVSRAAAKQSYTSFFLVGPRPRGWCIRRQVYQVLPTPFTWGLSQWENYAIQRNSALDSFSIFREFTAKKFLTVRQEPVKYEFELIVRMPCWPRTSTEFKFGHTVLPRKQWNYPSQISELDVEIDEDIVKNIYIMVNFLCLKSTN